MPPRLGEHTEQVLREVLGLDAERIGRLRQTKVI
jgi:crotonobetainyl-CoA:carnitine CoA-transferase CaiB-like acyl-CoA transferase